MNIGMACYGPIGTGLGNEARRFWRYREQIGLNRWLISPHPNEEEIAAIDEERGVYRMSRKNDWGTAVEFMKDLDCVFFIERPFPDEMITQCNSKGIETVMMVNPEWTPDNLPWLKECSLFVARNKFGAQHLDRDWETVSR